MAFKMELMVRLEDLVPSNHTYRKLKKYWDFSQIARTLDQKEYYSSHKGFGMFKCLLISIQGKFIKIIQDDISKAILTLNGFVILI